MMDRCSRTGHLRAAACKVALSLRLLLLATPLLLPSSRAQAQVFQLQGGSSTLYHAHGGSVEFRGSNYEGWVGVGYLDQLRFGAFLRTKVRNYTLSFGDEEIPFRLPTDVFDSSHYFFGRGVGVATKRERVSLFGFAGTTSSGFAAPFFRAARSEAGVGLLFLEAQLSPTVRAFSHNVVSNRQTTINGLEWRPRQDLQMALAGGVGANNGYLSASLAAERQWVTVKAGYVGAEKQFRRIVVEAPLNSEVTDENLLVVLRPNPFITLTGSHQNFLQPPFQQSKALQGTVDQMLANFTVAGLKLGGGLYRSTVNGSRNTGTSLSVGRGFAGRLELGANLFHSRPNRGSSSTTLVGNLREVISPRLSLLQLVTHSNGQTSVSFGGDFLSNRLTIGVEYQTLYVPFRVGNPFKQALVLNLRLQPFGNFRVNAGTFVAPNGAVKYTLSSGTYLYRNHEIRGSEAATAVTLPKYMVRGRVTDEEGKAVRGATLRIGSDTVFTDSQGRFFIRKGKATTYRLEVLLEEFLAPGPFEVVSAPSTVISTREEGAPEVTIVVRALRRSPQ